MSIRYIPFILGGIVIVVGLNLGLAIRDSKMWDKIDKQEQFYDEFMEKIDKREEYKEYESPLEDPNPNVGFGIK